MSAQDCKRILVTGAAGYFGSRLVGQLLASGYFVRSFDKHVYGAGALAAYLGHTEFEVVKGDIRLSSSVTPALDGIDAVVHLAAVVGEPACDIAPALARSINIDGAEVLLAAAQKCRVKRFVLASTCSIYGIQPGDVLATEETSMAPVGLYAECKVLAERAALAADGPAATVLRFGTLCGTSARMRFDLLVNELARNVALSAESKLFAPEVWRPFLHIADACRAVQCVLTRAPSLVAGKVFNVITENFRKLDLAEIVQQVAPDAKVVVERGAGKDPRDYRVSTKRIEEQLGFLPQCSIRQAFLDVLCAVRLGMYPDPLSTRHSALTDPHSLEMML